MAEAAEVVQRLAGGSWDGIIVPIGTTTDVLSCERCSIICSLCPPWAR